ncbi:KdsC family phosphatase [Membranihabitans maritimus]|uniref:KdsC family phosphatase n=1 Tax=Membranihabitans maritimus TaxID=2904244 RepID=UPI001F490E1F|nr:HAD hydrolase family protein [Membranihabitans maritimus]
MDLQIFKNIELLILDVDGVLTNTEILITEKGELLRTMNTRDGYAMKRLIAAGIDIMIITGGSSKGVVNRLSNVGAKKIYTGIHNKWEVLKEIVRETSIPLKNIAYMGDDILDMQCIQEVGLGCCPADATREVLSISQFVSSNNGGAGCVRDLIERILKSKDLW